MENARTVIGVLASALILAACAGDAGGPISPSGGAGMGPGISVAEALASRAEGPYLVNGWLWAEGAEVRLCSSLSGSSPPQCVTPSLTVQGLDLGTVAELRSERGVSWSQQTVQLLGEVSRGVLTIAALSKG